MATNIRKQINLDSGRRIKTWWDKYTRRWITQLVDGAGNFVAEEVDRNSTHVSVSQMLMRDEDAKLEGKLRGAKR